MDATLDFHRAFLFWETVIFQNGSISSSIIGVNSLEVQPLRQEAVSVHKGSGYTVVV